MTVYPEHEHGKRRCIDYPKTIGFSRLDVEFGVLVETSEVAGALRVVYERRVWDWFCAVGIVNAEE